jgi:hypothetical protein
MWFPRRRRCLKVWNWKPLYVWSRSRSRSRLELQAGQFKDNYKPNGNDYSRTSGSKGNTLSVFVIHETTRRPWHSERGWANRNAEVPGSPSRNGDEDTERSLWGTSEEHPSSAYTLDMYWRNMKLRELCILNWGIRSSLPDVIFRYLPIVIAFEPTLLTSLHHILFFSYKTLLTYVEHLFVYGSQLIISVICTTEYLDIPLHCRMLLVETQNPWFSKWLQAQERRSYTRQAVSKVNV